MLFEVRKRTCAPLLCLLTGFAEIASAETLHLRMSLETTAHPTAVDSNGDGQNAAFAVSQGRSNQGPVTREAWLEVLAWDGVTSCGPTNIQLSYLFVENSVRFRDGSRLFFVLGTGTVCFDFATSTFEGSGSVQVTGGTGRFAGATGSLAHQLTSGIALPNGLLVSSETFEGAITVPERRD